MYIINVHVHEYTCTVYDIVRGSLNRRRIIPSIQNHHINTGHTNMYTCTCTMIYKHALLKRKLKLNTIIIIIIIIIITRTYAESQ